MFYLVFYLYWLFSTSFVYEIFDNDSAITPKWVTVLFTVFTSIFIAPVFLGLLLGKLSKRN